jgi:hypothetical protein
MVEKSLVPFSTFSNLFHPCFLRHDNSLIARNNDEEIGKGKD